MVKVLQLVHPHHAHLENPNMAQVAFVGSDNIGSLACVGPVAKSLKSRGLNVRFFAVGPAVQNAGKYDLQVETDIPGDAEAWDDLIASINPAVIVVGCSYPLTIEGELAAAAGRSLTSLVVMSDIKNAWRRHDIEDIFALVLTGDEQDAREARGAGFKADAIGMHQAVLPTGSPEADRVIATAREGGRKVVLAALSGQPARIAQELACVLASSNITSIPHTLIVQPNPKILPKDHPDGGTWGEWLRTRTEEAGAVFSAGGPLVLGADLTISPASGSLVALVAGNAGAGLRVTEVESVLAAEPGAIENLDWLESLGVPVIREPVDLTPLFDIRPSVDIKALNPDLTAECIVQFLS